MQLRFMRRAAWPAVGTVVAIILVGAHFRHARTAIRTPDSRVAVETIPVPPGAEPGVLRLSGTIAALRSATIFAPRVQGSRNGVNRGGAAITYNAAGTAMAASDFNLVLVKLANPGEPVKEGEIIAEFDPVNQLQRVDDYKDAVVQMDASIKRLMANLEANKEAHDQLVRNAKAAWDQSVLDVSTGPVVSAIQEEEYKLDASQNEATYKQLVYEASLVDEQQRAQVRVSELNRDQAKLELERAEANVAKMTIRAPMDGVVVMASIVRNGEFGQVRQGDQVNSGQPFMYVVDPASLVLNATVNQVDAEKLSPGLKATVHLDAYPDCQMTGRVVGIGAMAQTSTFRASYVAEIPIRVLIARADPRVIPDLTGSADIDVAAPAAGASDHTR